MKIAVSIPDEVFEKAELLARGAGRSRSEFYSAALREYVARHSPDEVTERMNRAVSAIGEEPAEFIATAATRTLRQSEW